MAYPRFSFKRFIIEQDGYSFRDPSEVLLIDGAYWVYFTGVRAGVDGFQGSVWCSHCSAATDPSRPDNWSHPREVIAKGDPQHDHDGTGCFTPDCFYDGARIFVFYTALNSTHERGLPQWSPAREPEHIMVARATHPTGPFVKTQKHTPLGAATRALDYDEATVPGGHTQWQGKAIRDVSLIDHGQCWVMPDGERRYYYKGGGAGAGGSVCLMRHYDESWLNGQRVGGPIIDEGTHMEGILITQVGQELFLQLALIWQSRKWRTYTSPADDGINWILIDEGYLPKPDCDYPLSIGVYQTHRPQWGIGQFPVEEGRIGLAYLDIH